MIQLGDRVRDKVTGFEGVAIARVGYLNGCVQYCVKPPVDKDGKMLEGEYIDEDQLEFVGDGVTVETAASAETAAPGGPASDAPSASYSGNGTL